GAGRYHFPVMHCQEFLERHTDFRDGLITAPREVRRFTRHLANCPECRSYDVAVRRGVQALHAAAAIAPSPGFRQRLERRLARERAAGTPLPARAGFAASLLVLIALALLVLDFQNRPPVTRVPSLPPVAFPKPVVNPGLPFVTFQDPRVSVVNGNPHPYGTALVQPALTTLEPISAGR
ncbi:MAG: zf-HC2 domain-containing protein, partial [Gemmatimonadales bacterium]